MMDDDAATSSAPEKTTLGDCNPKVDKINNIFLWSRFKLVIPVVCLKIDPRAIAYLQNKNPITQANTKSSGHWVKL
jgi:hypothetical protein